MLVLLILFVGMILPPALSPPASPPKTSGVHDLVFPDFARTWDEALPLGNGLVGALVWRNGPFLRLSLDRADLWDLRPMPNIGAPEWSFAWVARKWAEDRYDLVQKMFDAPYEESPAPTKIPAGAIEF
ncbi:MAG: hypothetical protein JW843_12915, partial [Candidatus Aminicenantes bacterium]|nr:hypothetical protein [Candidatus Aminicenantes bacterium]